MLTTNEAIGAERKSDTELEAADILIEPSEVYKCNSGDEDALVRWCQGLTPAEKQNGYTARPLSAGGVPALALLPGHLGLPPVRSSVLVAVDHL
ncbi:hypothetical protein PoB_002701800 [Plakobranchus ocellatus]|uniref:Uncharacterized protein n=1 Tax=Plakobranchus ocellatus TaxID=259542 RepID=A0AAV4A1D6_9GAST|nr:hypothetical protein PoB_002701800 [Plakobranchus ocellatus]